MHVIHLIFHTVLFADFLYLTVLSFDKEGPVDQPHAVDMVAVLLFFLALLTPAFAHFVAVNWQERLQNKLLAPGTY